MRVTAIGLDPSKGAIRAHGADQKDHTALKRKMSRPKTLFFFSN